MIGITGLAAFQARLDALALDAAIARGLGQAAEHIGARVRAALNTPPGGSHTMPWRRSGARRDSITATATDTGAVVASGADVAVYQELGTAHISPRPFMAPVAAEQADAAARALAAEITAACQME